MKKSLGPTTKLCPLPVWIIGTYDKSGKPNIMTASWTGIASSDPPSLSLALRKATYTYGNIVARKAFTVNVPSESMADKVDYAGIVSGKKENKFSTLGLTSIKGEHVDAPYVKECLLIAECELIKTVEAGLHTLFIGKILDVKSDESILGEDNLPEMEKLKPFVYNAVKSTYYKTGNFLGKAFSIGKPKSRT